uniref:Uncharacterized protein n=1 Tax=Endocarpon pusillum TaxID=364733 RepID=F8QWV9_9EURO|nr:hypothetical protein [Endocarpon pusillum]
MVKTTPRRNSSLHRHLAHMGPRLLNCKHLPSKCITQLHAHLKTDSILPLHQPIHPHPPKKGRTSMWLLHRANRLMQLFQFRALMLHP